MTSPVNKFNSIEVIQINKPAVWPTNKQSNERNIPSWSHVNYIVMLIKIEKKEITKTVCWMFHDWKADYVKTCEFKSFTSFERIWWLKTSVFSDTFFVIQSSWCCKMKLENTSKWVMWWRNKILLKDLSIIVNFFLWSCNLDQ
jgi:hypothetical protein